MDNIDPNVDAAPPRHALESDSEDEFNPLSSTEQTPALDIKLLGDIPTQHNLVVATGDTGALWAKGAHLGEQTGAVAANGIMVGFVFSPSWTKAIIIVSEALTRLPVWVMHPYAQAIIGKLQPLSVALLDEYPVPSYITPTPSTVDNAPIRYLSTSSFDPDGKAEPFAPPNLINTTSASFLSLLTISNIPGTLILTPSPNIPKPAPQSIQPGSTIHPAQLPPTLMEAAHQLLFRAINEPTDQGWQLDDSSAPPQSTASAARRFEIGEGGMYI